MSATDILRVPSRRKLGKFIARCVILPGIGKWLMKCQRIRRKRFLANLKSPRNHLIVGEVLLHPSGKEFQSALEAWAKAPPFFAKPLANVGNPPRKNFPLRCSVIINTVDRGPDLALTLDALRTEWDDSQDELIIVLGPSADDSEDIIRQSAITCRLIHCPVRNLAVSRNLGWQAANGRYVAFIDDDASPAPGWLAALLNPLEHNPQAAVSAGFVLDGRGEKFLNRYVVADTLGRAFWCDDAAAAQAKMGDSGTHRSFLTATGCNMAFRHSVLEEIGGFDPFYQYFLEETDAVWRVISAGYRCVIAPESRVLHRLGANLTRKPALVMENRTLVVRSQIHYIGKFGKSAFPPTEIQGCIWERVLQDLEKIAWDCGPGGQPGDPCADLQCRYLQAVTTEFGTA